MSHTPKLTNNFGAPLPDNDHTLTAGERGPVLLQDYFFIEKIAAFDRERIPERVVHAKGSGAHGYFECTHDMSAYTRASLFNGVGKKTPLLVRFSTVGGERGSADAERDPRGFAVKFYTEEGNYDLVGNNTPVFFIRDPMKFPDFIHTQKRNPQTNLKDHEAFWDFLSYTPEAIHQLTILFSDRGVPKTYRHMDGFGSHTFMWTNSAGKSCYIKYHFKTETGIENLIGEAIPNTKGQDPDHAGKDLFESIAAGTHPAWQVSVQIMPVEDAHHYRYDPFDVTRVWLHKDYPLIPVGRMVLDRNPVNYFNEVEQAAFSPANFVPGIEPSPDKLLQGRLFSYPDTQRHRLGPNYAQIKVNCPYGRQVVNHQRDGQMRVDDNGGNSPNYAPNSHGGPEADPGALEAQMPLSGNTGRTAYPTQGRADDFEQAGLLFRLFTEDERTRLIDAIVDHMKPASEATKRRQLQHFMRADKEYGTRIAQGLGL
jgi:catalase